MVIMSHLENKPCPRTYMRPVFAHRYRQETTSDQVVDDVQSVMMSLIKLNPAAWAPIISAWSIDLLGVASSKCIQRRNVPQTSNLNELLQMWMTCHPSKVLVDIASECFASMMGGSPDICVDALLEASVKYSPHFDWVVAHIGSCFPRTIITRVLMCGLEDYFVHGNSQTEMMPSSEENIPKMASVVGILGHLAGHHGRDIREALLKLFKDSLEPSCSTMQLCVVPFILQLASMSPMLLSVVTTNLVDTLNPEIMNRVAGQFAMQQKTKGTQDYDSLIDLVVHLLSQSEEGSLQVLKLLIDSACSVEIMQDAMETNQLLNPVISQSCAVIIERLLVDLQRRVHTRSNSSSVEMPLLRTLHSHSTPLCKQHASSSGIRQQWLARLLTCLAVYSGNDAAADIMCEILLTASNHQQLDVFVQVQQETEARFPQVLHGAILRVLDAAHTSNTDVCVQILTNLLWLVEKEANKTSDKKGKTASRMMLAQVLHPHLIQFASLLHTTDLAVSRLAMQILEAVTLPRVVDANTMIKLAAATTSLMFCALHSSDVYLKCHICCVCRRYLQKLCERPLAQKLILLLLLETALVKEYGVALGSKIEMSTANENKIVAAPVLLDANRLQRTGIPAAQLQSAVFHAGIIGRGLRKSRQLCPFTKEQEQTNRQIYMDTFAACCHDNRPTVESSLNVSEVDIDRSDQMSARLARSLALMLIEQLSPDVMFNGIPWPDEEFMKVTMERDLLIKKKFEDNPILWDILEFLASGPGAMCYSSVILRALVATLLAFWDASREKSAKTCEWHLSASIRVISCMKKGQLIPAPLCHIGEILPLVTPYEVFLLLQMVWKYVKENPPVPDPLEYPRNDCIARYTAVLRSILHNNIDKLGHLYQRFFPTASKVI